MEFSGQAFLLDIEGTTSSISFVYDEMFPFVRKNLNQYLSQNFGDGSLNAAIDGLAVDSHQDPVSWLKGKDEAEARETIAETVISLMDNDIKGTGLKDLQGKIWKSGFESGQLQAHVYPDVLPAIQSWRQAGKEVRIYSSGSIAAQKLFFSYSVCGDMLSCFSGHYDTTIGPKKEAASYHRIVSDFSIPAADILFISDVPAELDAAADAGLQTVLSIRPGNKEISEPCDHPRISSFAEITLNAVSSQ